MKDDKLEPVVLLLLIGIIFFTGMILVCEKWYPMDGQLFQVMASLLSGFSGAFFMRIKPRGQTPDDPKDPNVLTAAIDVEQK